MAKDELIKLEAELNLSKQMIRVKPMVDKFTDMNLWLEVVGFLASLQNKPLEEIAEYAKKYILEAGKNYRVNQN